jgi:hypothetical protein
MMPDLTPGDMETRKALEIAFNQVESRYKLISGREWYMRDQGEERMLLIAGAILCKLKASKDTGEDRKSD